VVPPDREGRGGRGDEWGNPSPECEGAEMTVGGSQRLPKPQPFWGGELMVKKFLIEIAKVAYFIFDPAALGYIALFLAKLIFPYGGVVNTSEIMEKGWLGFFYLWIVGLLIHTIFRLGSAWSGLRGDEDG